MTFTEAAIEVLRREGKPLHFTKIAEIAIRENLLDHVGKIPEETMADQLSAHGRLPRAERRVIPVLPGTFALVEWGLEEDPAALENLIEPPPEEELPYRGRERHPVPSRDMARGAGGRGEGGRARRREEEEHRGRRFPPPAEVAYEILAGAGRPLALVDIAVAGAERTLMPDAFVRETASLEAALSEDNRRRESAGRKPLFQIEGETVTLVSQPEPGERAAASGARAAAAIGEARRSGITALRRRLRECDGPTVEHVAVRLLEKLGFRDLKVAKRGREHVIYTGKRRMGLGDVRHGVRIIRSGADAGRRDVGDLRRDLGHYGAQLGIVVSAGDCARDARGEAGAAGQLPVVLLCGDALAEALADAGVGCVQVVIPDVDEAFFRNAAELAEKEEAARRARREERERREAAREQPRPAEAPEPSEAPLHTVVEVAASAPAGDEDEDEGEGDGGPEEGEAEGAEVQAGASAPEDVPAEAPTGERRRRRRRRRRRGGRGRAREGAAPAPGAGAPTQSSEAPAGEGTAVKGSSAEPPPPGPGSTDDGGTAGG